MHQTKWSTSNGSHHDARADIICMQDSLSAHHRLLLQYSTGCCVNMHPSVMASTQERTCPVYKKICQPSNSDGSAGGPVHLVVGNAGYELSWFANPSPPDYWDKIVLEHGYSRCTANQTTLTCELWPHLNIAADVDWIVKLVSSV